VLVLGAYTAQQALESDVLDELQIHQTQCRSVMTVAELVNYF
jgi:hypothetical protein